MMKILCVGYRDWALIIYDKLAKNYHDGEIVVIRSYDEYSDSFVKDYNPDLILFYGWSWKVSDEIISHYKCLMLHPSNLPKYRGGSPIQNQIIDGIKDTKISIFEMNSEMDSGDILIQESLSLRGDILDIFSRMSSIGLELSLKIFNNAFVKIKQDGSNATYCKRRSCSDSEITTYELLNKSSEYLHNKVRMSTGPYPNAFILDRHGKKIFILKTKLEK